MPDYPVELSIVSPVYLGEHLVEELVKKISTSVERITPDYEIILVDDRSPDASWAKIEAVAMSNKHVIGLRLSRNFGQHCAITAGLEASHGRFVVVLDCDLQDDPAYIPALYSLALEGADIVFTRKSEREHAFLKNILAKCFYGTIAWLSRNPNARLGYNTGCFSIVSRKVVEAYLQMGDYHRHYVPLLLWLGFSPGFLDVKHSPRTVGKSSYTLPRLFHLAVNGIVAQSDRLLYLSVTAGFVFVIFALLGVASVVYQYIHSGLLPGWPSVIVVNLLGAGTVLMSLGVIGMYLGKTFEQAKGRPLYIVDRQTRQVQEQETGGSSITHNHEPRTPEAKSGDDEDARLV